MRPARPLGPAMPTAAVAAVLAAGLTLPAGPARADAGVQIAGFEHLCVETGAEIALVEARAMEMGGRRVDMAGPASRQTIGFALSHSNAGAFLVSASFEQQGGRIDRQCVLMRPEGDPRAMEAELRRHPGYGAPVDRIDAEDGNTYTLWSLDPRVPAGEVAMIERTRRDGLSVTLSLQRITEAGR